jgi:hypothetical protein
MADAAGDSSTIAIEFIWKERIANAKPSEHDHAKLCII